MCKVVETISFKSLLLVLICFGLAISCGSSSRVAEGNGGMEPLDTLMSTKNFEIRSNWAMPLATNSMNSLANAGLFPPGSSAGQINLIGNPNYVKVIGDSLSVYLPYFGERQMGGGYDSDGAGIDFEGIPEKLEITKNEEKQRYDIRVKMKDDSENFILTIILFPNLTSTINVNSSQRFPIRYSGSVQSLQSDD